MILTWEEIVVPKKKNGNKINNGDSIKRRKGYFVGTDGKHVAVACDDGVLRTVNLETAERVYWEEEACQYVNPT
jgi:hypothetical protein